MNVDTIDLPPSLRTQLEAFEKRLRRMETLVFICGGLCGLLISYFILFISDRFWNTPHMLRFVFLLAGVGVFAGFCRFWFRNWVWRRRDVCQMARLIQKRFPLLGDRLLGIIELADPSKRTEDISPELCRAAIRQVARQSDQLDFTEAVERRTPRRLGLIAGVCSLVLLCIVMVDPRAFGNALLRWLNPVASIARYTFVEIKGLPGQVVVAHGEKFSLPFSIGKRSRWVPETAIYRCGSEREAEARIQERRGTMTFEGQTRDVQVVVRAGDAVETVAVKPLYRPALLSLSADVKLPDYLKYPDQQVDIPSKKLTVLEGSRFVLRGRINRALQSARLETQKHPLELNVEAAKFYSPPLSADSLETGTITWTDQHGLSRKEAYEITVDERADEKPDADCPELARGLVLLESETKLIDVRALDDFGVKELGVQWEVNPQRDRSGTIFKRIVADGGPTRTELSGIFTFNSGLLNIPADSAVRMRAVAWDYHPRRGPGMSFEYWILVLSHASHIEQLRLEFEALQAKLEELIRAEEELLDANRGLNRLADEDLESEAASEKLKEHLKGEELNTEDLRRMIEHGLKLMKEALRNKDFPPETLKEWAELLEQMEALTKQDMQQIQQSLGQAQQSKAQRREQLQKAIEQQKKLLKKLRELQEKMGKSIDQMIARNFVNRLREAARQEGRIKQGLQQILARSVGLPAAKLPEELKEILGKLTDQHKGVRGEIRNVKEELLGFFNRTRKQKYQDVHEDMEKKKVLEQLDELTATIKDNQAVNGMKGADQWAKQFNQWADMLEEGDDSQSDQNQGEPRELTPEQLEILMAILQIVQMETDLRENTRALDRQKEEVEDYKGRSLKLAGTQRELRGKLREIEQKVGGQARALLQNAGAAMDDAEALLRKPDTGAETIAAENEVIELLTQTCKGGGGGGGMMASLMQMMGMGGGAGAMPGASNAGGMSNDPNEPVTGTADGTRDDPRAGKRGTGRSLDRVPEEYRDVLESYYRKLDEKGS